MAEYISREAALIAIRNLYPGIPLTKRLMQKWHEENRNFMQCESAIEKLPAADVRPTRHGRWLKTDDFSDEQIDWVSCGICKAKIPDFDYPYCPNCGCRMDLEVANER